MDFKCFNPGAKLLYIFGIDVRDKVGLILESTRQLGIPIDAIDPRDPQCFFVASDQDFQELPDQIPDFIRYLIGKYDQIIIFPSPHLNDHPIVARLIATALAQDKVIINQLN